MGIFNKAIEELGITALYETKDRINDIIQEELGISDVVDNATVDLCNRILSELKTATWETVERGVKNANLQFEYGFNGNPINVSVDCYNFVSYNVRKLLREKFPDDFFEEARSAYGKSKLPSSKKDIRQKLLIVNLLRVSGTVDVDRLRKSVKHELRHIYEQMMNGGTSFSNFKDNTLYMKACDMFNKSQDGTSQKDVGLLGYMSFNYERHAFIEEYFDGIKQLVDKLQNGNDSESEMRLFNYIRNDNPIISKIIRMRYTLTKLQQDDDDYISAANKMLENTGFTLEKFIKRAEDSIKDLSLRYGRCIVKAKQDYPIFFRDRRYNELSYIQNKHRPQPEYYI